MPRKPKVRFSAQPKKPRKVNIALKNIYHLAGNFSYLRKKFVSNDNFS